MKMIHSLEVHQQLGSFTKNIIDTGAQFHSSSIKRDKYKVGLVQVPTEDCRKIEAFVSTTCHRKSHSIDMNFEWNKPAVQGSAVTSVQSAVQHRYRWDEQYSTNNQYSEVKPLFPTIPRHLQKVFTALNRNQSRHSHVHSSQERLP